MTHSGSSHQQTVQSITALKSRHRNPPHTRLLQPELAYAYTNAARTLRHRLAPILNQLPPNLKVDGPLLRDFLHHLPRDLPAAFEFRHQSWFSDDTFHALQDFGAALCIAESDELATPRVRTAPFGYLRLRRTEYDQAQLRDWAAWVRGAGFERDVYCYFKHEDEARGPRFARDFQSLFAA